MLKLQKTKKRSEHGQIGRQGRAQRWEDEGAEAALLHALRGMPGDRMRLLKQLVRYLASVEAKEGSDAALAAAERFEQVLRERGPSPL
jgi:hypothetical protein